MSRRLPIAVALSFLAAALPGPAGGLRFTSTFEPIRVEARPGERVTRGFHLSLAPGERPVHFRAKVEDWWESEDGSQSFYQKSGTLPRSCGPWVELNPVEAAVAPGGDLDVRVTLSVPAEAGAGGYWCVLTLDELPDPLSTPPGVGVRFLASISIGIFVYVPPIDRQAQILDVQVGEGTAAVSLANTGNAPFALEGRFEFLQPGGAGEPLAVVDLPRTTVLLPPVGRRVVRAPLPGSDVLPPGRYHVRVLLDIGLDHYLGAQKEIELRSGSLGPVAGR